MTDQNDEKDLRPWPPPDRSGGLRPGNRDVYPATEEPTFTPEITHPVAPKGNIPLKRPKGKRNGKKAAS